MGHKLKILVVDDEESARVMLSHMASFMGHDTVQARNGREAVELYQKESPDLILMDVMMPELNGFEATAQIRRQPAEKWVPVVYLSALQREGNMMKGLDAGGDDYMVKPVNLADLSAKIRAFERVTTLHRRLEAKRVELEYYYQQAEDEARIGSHLMASLTSVAGLKDEALRYWARPMKRFGGDLVAAARTPGDVLHVMVADAVGHGLPAALNVLPLADAFYSMTAEGFSIAHIVQALNRKIRSLMPVDRFVTATLVSVDSYKKEIQIWNGGNPPPLFVGASGDVRECGGSAHLPLGLLSDSAGDVQPDVMVCEDMGQLAVFTDGLCEAQDESGAYWGIAGIKRSLAGAPRMERFQRLVDDFGRHLGERPAQDDASLMLIDLCCNALHSRALQVESAPAVPADEPDSIVPGWSVKFRFGAHELKRLDMIPFLTSVVEKLESSEGHRREIFIILSELVNNAVEHGLLNLDSSMKSSFDGFENYMRERKLRLEALHSGWLEIALERTKIEGMPAIRIHIRDSGDGFDYKSVDIAGSAPNLKPYGRGIMLVNTLCHTLQYVGDGNEVVCYFRL